MSYHAAPNRHDVLGTRRSGQSGLVLPLISLGLWWNFGDDRPLSTQREIVLHAFDRGIFHFDLANNYGPPAGAAEENFGRIYARDLRRHRHELVISTKAGWRMFPGPHGFGGSAKYLLGSLDNSLTAMGLDYVDIFYSHRPDGDTPLEETCRALDQAVRSGKARYVGISSYAPQQTRRAQKLMRELGTPLVIHQPSYSMLNRWIEDPTFPAPSAHHTGETTPGGPGSLLHTCDELGMGMIGFSPLAQGMLTNKYLGANPHAALRSSRAGASLHREMLKPEVLTQIRHLHELAQARGQSLAQMAIAWVLRDQRITSALIGASSVAQLDDSLGAVTQLEFTADELAAIDRYATDAGINIWREATETLSP
ncbi:MAG: aldo/keto reductase [Bowdeniella nasicola]|nr:aldo/keto reductase [Bowdeniella nasicola]